MTGYAIHSQYQDASATLVIKPLLFANDMLVKNSRPKEVTATNTQAMQTSALHDKVQELMSNLKAAAYQLDTLEADALYLNREQQAKQAEELSLVASLATTLKETVEKLSQPSKEQSPAEAELFLGISTKFEAFYARLQEVHEFISHLANTPDPDEDSPEFGEFLISLGKML